MPLSRMLSHEMGQRSSIREQQRFRPFGLLSMTSIPKKKVDDDRCEQMTEPESAYRDT